MTTSRSASPLLFADEFDGTELDPAVWLPHYLPAWSSRAATVASYKLHDSCLQLSIPPEQDLWCAGDHTPALRVSGIQTGNFSGPVGSTIGQQPYRDGLRVHEAQETFWGWTPDSGYIELRARSHLHEQSMFSFWMVGLEDQPERSAEICVVEVFGNAVVPGDSAAVGMGLHRFRDPEVSEDWEAVRLPIDVAEFHTYAVDWTADSATFLVDETPIRSCPKPPTYPMQMMLAVFDFPETGGEGVGASEPAASVAREFRPSLEVDYLRAYER